MNKKEILEQYVNNLSQYYNENKFEDFLLYFNSYNMDKPYLSDISKDSYILYTHIIEVLNENSYTFKFNDNKCYTIENINDKYLPIKVCFPYFIKDINIIIDNILDFLIKEKINFKFEISKLNKNYTFSMYLEKVNDLKMFISYLKQFRLYNKLIKNILNPFIPIYGGFGIIYEYEKFDYLSFILLNLTDFFSLNKYDNNYNSENFLNYIKEKIFSENNLSLRRMLVIIYRCLKTILDQDNILDLFNYDSNMNISSVKDNDYLIKIKNNVIYFVNKIDLSEVYFGNEYYLNIAYSKMYNRIIEMSENSKYYVEFYKIYDNLLNNCYNINEINLLLDDKDEIYKQLYILSSGFFAIKKMAFDLKIVNEIIKQLYKNELKIYIIENKIDNENIKKEVKTDDKLPFDDEFLKSVFTLKSGKVTTVIAYFKINNVLETIPVNSIITLKNGKEISGIVFLKNIKILASKFDTFRQIVDNFIEFIEY